MINFIKKMLSDSGEVSSKRVMMLIACLLIVAVTIYAVFIQIKDKEMVKSGIDALKVVGGGGAIGTVIEKFTGKNT
jgi:hypothetical protein